LVKKIEDVNNNSEFQNFSAGSKIHKILSWPATRTRRRPPCRRRGSSAAGSSAWKPILFLKYFSSNFPGAKIFGANVV
jgi:hypothetical protein